VPRACRGSRKKRDPGRHYAAARHDFGDFAMVQVFELKRFY
jgi:hypothetical protein